MITMKNSHIQLSKGHMNPFSHIKKVNCVYVLDIKSKRIDEIDVKCLDTKLGFYSDEVETAMNNQYEARFFSLRDKIVNFFENNKERKF